VPEKGRLLLVGFGSSAHIVIQVALHRGHEIWVVTRSENHIRQARELGAAWAGSDFRDVPGQGGWSGALRAVRQARPADIGSARSRRDLLHRWHTSQRRAEP
jgi:D-arabinose 1-dehydrogenase-like Zn-dependent alcohol dehydrogenase